MLEIMGFTDGIAGAELQLVSLAQMWRDVFRPRHFDTHRWDRLNLCTNLLPSANQICREVTGRAWSSVTMGIGGDSPSSCTDGDLATTLGATLGVDRNIVSAYKTCIVCFLYFLMQADMISYSLTQVCLDSGQFGMHTVMFETCRDSQFIRLSALTHLPVGF